VANNEQIASRDRPIGISVPLGRTLGEILGPHALAYRPDRPELKHYRRYVWAVLRDVEMPLDATTRVRLVTNCHNLNSRPRLDHPSYTTSVSFFGSEHASHFAAQGRGTNGMSMYVDLTQALWRLDAQGARSDRLTVQLLPHCANNETNV